MFKKIQEIKTRIKQAKIAAIIVGVVFLLMVISNIHLQYKICVMADEIEEIKKGS